MKSFCLIRFFILAIFVVTSKTNNLNQIDVKISISNTVSKAWLKEISGYDENDSKNGYAGVIGEPMTSLRIDGGKSYRVHSYNTKSWLEKVNGNNMNDNVNGYAGVKYGDKIDAIVIGGGVEYAIHTLGEFGYLLCQNIISQIAFMAMLVT